MGHGLGCGGVTDVRGNVVLGDSVLVPFFTCVGQRPFLLCFWQGWGFERSNEVKEVWALPRLPELVPRASPSASEVLVEKRGCKGKRAKAVGNGL